MCLIQSNPKWKCFWLPLAWLQGFLPLILQIQHTSPHWSQECYLKLTKMWLWKLTNQGRHFGIFVSIFLQEYCYNILIFEKQAKKKSIPRQSPREKCTWRLSPFLSPVIWGAWGCQPLYVISHNDSSGLRDGNRFSNWHSGKIVSGAQDSIVGNQQLVIW